MSNSLSTNLKDVVTADACADTEDIVQDNIFDFEVLKNNYLNDMISWPFLKKLSDYNQWPIGCIAKFIDNSMKQEVSANKIEIEVHAFKRKYNLLSKM